MGAQYFCKNELRRAVVRDARDGGGNPLLNGIDYLEVDASDQRILVLHFIHPLPGQPNGFPASPPLEKQNIAIEGGVRIQNIRVQSVVAAGNELTITVTDAGDFSTYLLRVTAGTASENPPTGFDPQLSEVDFSFKIDCPSDFDCQPEQDCPPETLPEPSLDYLAKDFASFRRLMLDRLATILPDWQERNPADVGVALVETLAYAADQLSYYQDAVATEAYLDTARRRVSVRRHARLLDYPMHDGVNARVWVQVQVSQDNVSLPAKTQLLTRVPDFEVRLSPDSRELELALSQETEVFETLHTARLFLDHNEIHLYTWGNQECCLPRGATQATLLGGLSHLEPGDVLVFEEARGPSSGLEADADPSHRQAVRLTRVTVTADPLGGQFKDIPDTNPVPVTEVSWRVEDALTFPLCLSARSGTQAFGDLSLARGNIVLADHGRTLKDQPLQPDTVPFVEDPERSGWEGKYRPRLGRTGITQHVPYDHSLAIKDPAFVAPQQDPRLALPDIKLRGGGETWLPQRDLLGSDRFSSEFVVEVEDDGRATLRFGDDIHGRSPSGGIRLLATYRIGNGSAGNIGADSLYHVVSPDSRISAVRNPLPAQGGTEPEPSEQVRLYAPQAFRTQERAVTAEDYATMAQRHPDVQKAVATLRWTGSWKTVFITVDRKGGRPVSPEFEADLRLFLERFRLAGHDLEIDAPRFVPLDITLTVCLKSGYTKAAVKQALLETFSNADLPSGSMTQSAAGGRRGFFHPDNITFGQTIYLSQLVAAAMGVPGVEWVETTRFQRWGQASHDELDTGFIELGRLEIARLDNDPNLPENGRIEFIMEGGL
jgi:hypothetical protein